MPPKSGENYLDAIEFRFKTRDLLIRIFDDLKKQKVLQANRTMSERRAMNNIMQNANNFTETVNGLASQFDLVGTPERFDSIAIKGYKYAFLVVLIAQYNLQVENFRNLLLYVLRNTGRINHRTSLGSLMREICNLSDTAKELNNMISVEFRNAFAHSRFWITEQEIQYVTENDFDHCKAIRHTDFIVHARIQNIITECLGDIINKYYLPQVK